MKSQNLEMTSGALARPIIVLRLVLAFAVIFHHTYGLAGLPPPLLDFSAGQESLGLLAVACFFALSGYLVTQSYLRRDSALDFLRARFLRIFPGFWVALALTAFLFAPFIYYQENQTLKGFLTQPDGPAQFMLKNLLLRMNQHGIGDLLASNPYPRVLNGSLWSLSMEFACYILTVLLGSAGILKQRKKMLICFILAVTAYGVWSFLQPGPLKISVAERWGWYGLYFVAGSLGYFYRKEINYHPLAMLICAGLLASAMKTGGYGFLAIPGIPYLTLGILKYLPELKGMTGRDFSYGFYLYAFPIQQTLIFFGLHRWNLFGSFLAALVLTAPFAWMSERWVETPYRKLK